MLRGHVPGAFGLLSHLRGADPSGINHLSHAQDASIHKKRFYGAASLAVSGGVVLYKWGAF